MQPEWVWKIIQPLRTQKSRNLSTHKITQPLNKKNHTTSPVSEWVIEKNHTTSQHNKIMQLLKNIARIAKSCPESWSAVKMLRCSFLLKDVIINTFVTTVIFITITIWVFKLSQFYFVYFCTIWVFEFGHNLIFQVLSQFFFKFYHSLSFWVCHNLGFFSFVTVWFFFSFVTIRIF